MNTVNPYPNVPNQNFIFNFSNDGFSGASITLQFQSSAADWTWPWSDCLCFFFLHLSCHVNGGNDDPIRPFLVWGFRLLLRWLIFLCWHLWCLGGFYQYSPPPSWGSLRLRAKKRKMNWDFPSWSSLFSICQKYSSSVLFCDSSPVGLACLHCFGGDSSFLMSLIALLLGVRCYPSNCILCIYFQHRVTLDFLTYIFDHLLCETYTNNNSSILRNFIGSSISVLVFQSLVQFLTAFLVICIPMDKGKRKKKSFLETITTEVSKADDSVENLHCSDNGSPNPPLGDAPTPPSKDKGKEPFKSSHEVGQSSKSSKKLNASSYLAKLSKVRENFQKVKDTSLLGVVVGKHIDFNRIMGKLKADWKNINGVVEFIDRQFGWFEIRFSNPIDRNNVWEGRPYHIFGQLLLLQPWRAGFNPQNEPIQNVDLWVRIPLLPPEYYNFDSIQTIMEENHVGTLIRLDPAASKKRWVKFARFCICIDVSRRVDRTILIPDESEVLKPFTLWFEDIPEGCGNCGALNHTFNNCPLRKYIPPKLQIIFKKPNPCTGSSHRSSSSSGDWKTVPNKNEKNKNTATAKQTQPQALGGLSFIYQSVESSLDSKKSANSSSDNSLKVPGEMGVPALDPSLPAQTDVVLISSSPSAVSHALPNPVCQDTTTKSTPPLAPDLSTSSKSDKLGHDQLTPPTTPHQPDDDVFLKDLSKYQENFDCDDDNLLFEEDDDDLFMEDSPYPVDDISHFLNNEPLPDMPLEDVQSFHSLNSESSMIQKLVTMEMLNKEPSSSESSKRKSSGGVGDTASSYLKGSKKPRKE